MPTIACHNTEIPPALPEGAAQWVHLLPLGSFRGRDGRGPYRLDDAPALIRASLARAAGMDLVVDYDHQAEDAADKRGPVPAAGWIKELEARDDGIYGRIEWTDAARAALKAREYRYISPVFMHTKDGKALALLRAGLTNVPNLGLKAVASQTPSITEIDQMEFLEKLAALFGLPEGATEDDVVTHCQKLTEGQKNSALHTQITRALGLDDGAEEKDVLKAVHSAVAAADGGSEQPDPAKYVPMQAFRDLQGQVATMIQAHDAKAASAAVDAAIADGKLTPAMRDWGVSLHSADPQKFEDFVSAAPVISAAAQDMAQAGEPAAGQGRLTEEEKSVCRQLGISEEEFMETKGDDQ